MWRFILTIVLLILSVWVGVKIAADPGVAVFLYRDWSVEMPLWFAALAVIVVMLVIYAVMRFVDGVDSTLYRWRNWLQWRRKHRSYNKTNRGLLEIIEGRWRSAETHLLEGVHQSDAPLINYLAAAKAAHEQGSFDKRDVYLRKAHDLAPQAEVAIGLTQAQLQLNQGQLEQALATLGSLRQIAPKHAMVLHLLEKLYVHLGDWQGLLKLIPALQKAKIVNAQQAVQLEERAYLELFNAAATKADDSKTLDAAWQLIPRRLQRNAHLVFAYGQYALAYPEKADEIETLINKSIKHSWDSNLVKLYGFLVTTQPKKQLAHAEGWLKSYHNHGLLLLTLGRLCMRCQLWGKARSYFEDSLNIEANPATNFALGKLLEQLGDIHAAAQSYREGLAQVEYAR